ncbi:hypothetical protein ACFE04_028641 [Oxalis oulophora]
MTSCQGRLTSHYNTIQSIKQQSQQYSPVTSADILNLPRRRRPVIVLRRSSSLTVKAAEAAAASGGGVWEDDNDNNDRSKLSAACKYARDQACVRGRVVEEIEKKSKTVEIVVAAVMTVVLGVGNRVLYKLALVPLKHYPFFLAQLATFGSAGIVTDEMLSMPKAPFIIVGLLEALAAATGMAAGAILSGASIPILSQTFLVWQILLSIIFLGRRYKFNQLLGCFLVAIGVVITVASGSSGGHSLKEVSIFWSVLMIISFLLQAADTVVKEMIFLNAARQLKGGSIDLFVVNSYGSAFQALFIFLLLPFLSKLWGVPFIQLPSYLKDGAACFLNINSLSSGCAGAPLLPLLFVLVNMGFNISLLHLLKISSAVVSSLASTFSVPISVYIFTLPLPYLGVASSLPTGFVAGGIILVLGLLTYAWTPSTCPSSASVSPNK